MPTHRSSRYLRQPRVQTVDSRGTFLAFEQRDTTVFEDQLPTGTRTLINPPGGTLPALAKRFLGRQQFWWVLADLTPEVFYPLDLVDGDTVRVPPLDSLQRFQRRR